VVYLAQIATHLSVDNNNIFNTGYSACLRKKSDGTFSSFFVPGNCCLWPAILCG